jgi:hypothetical protein
MITIKHLITAGCSFTGNGLGGHPPTQTEPGGCSFIDYEDNPATIPGSWAGFLAQELAVTSLVNIACISHGNLITSTVILELLKKYAYNKDNTLIVFDVAYFNRFDIPCDFDHPDASKFIPWDKSIIPYSYLSRQSSQYSKIEKTVGLDNVPSLSSNALEYLCSYLDYNNFEYAFLPVENFKIYSEFNSLIKNRRHRFIDLNPGTGMREFSQLTNNLHNNKYHPSVTGHKLIAQNIISHLKEFNII